MVLTHLSLATPSLVRHCRYSRLGMGKPRDADCVWSLSGVSIQPATLPVGNLFVISPTITVSTKPEGDAENNKQTN